MICVCLRWSQMPKLYLSREATGGKDPQGCPAKVGIPQVSAPAGEIVSRGLLFRKLRRLNCGLAVAQSKQLLGDGHPTEAAQSPIDLHTTWLTALDFADAQGGEFM